MKIALHTNQLDGRGTGKTPYDYGLGLQRRNHDVVFVTSSLSPNEGLARIQREFPVVCYDRKVDQHPAAEVRAALAAIVERERIDFLHFLKYGHDDGITPDNCRTGIHCVFTMRQPHGDVYAAVSATLARKHGQKLFVPHIVKNYPPTKDLRRELGLPADKFVVGRHGGFDTFDLPFVHEAVAEALRLRPDLYFLFLSTRKFIEHPRAIFLPWVESEQDKFNFIHACDAMLHARKIGETFGLAVGEFSAANRPVITWSGRNRASYDKAHLEILGGKALVYHEKSDLRHILLKIDRAFVSSRTWDVYTQAYGEEQVMQVYDDVFLQGSPPAGSTEPMTTASAH